MLRRYTFWLTAAVLFQVLSGLLHTVSLFIAPSGEGATEQQMISLITTYKLDMGAGFHPTFFNLFTALSSSFSFLFFFAALTNAYLLWKGTSPKVMRGIIGINLVIFGPLLVIMAWFTFLIPITCVGLVVINLLAAFFVVPSIESAVD